MNSLSSVNNKEKVEELNLLF